MSPVFLPSSPDSMHFTTCSTPFFTNYQSLGSVQLSSHIVQPTSSMASIYVGVRTLGSWISMSRSTSFWGSWGFRAQAVGMARSLAGLEGIQTEKETTQDLNGHLASYLDRVRSLETDSQWLKSTIQEHLEKKGPQVRDWRH